MHVNYWHFFLKYSYNEGKYTGIYIYNVRSKCVYIFYYFRIIWFSYYWNSRQFRTACILISYVQYIYNNNIIGNKLMHILYYCMYCCTDVQYPLNGDNIFYEKK